MSRDGERSVFEQILELLDSRHVGYTLTEHQSVRTSEEAARIRGVALRTGAKAMIVKYQEGYALLVLPADRQIDWRQVRAMLHVSNVRLATADEAEEVARVQMGSVPPFGNVLGLPTFFDERLLENETLNFNPGSLTHSIAMRSADVRALVDPVVGSFTKSRERGTAAT